LLSGGRTPPSVMPIDSPHEPCIRRKRELPGGCTAPWPACSTSPPVSPLSMCSKPTVAECCTCFPVCHARQAAALRAGASAVASPIGHAHHAPSGVHTRTRTGHKLRTVPGRSPGVPKRVRRALGVASRIASPQLPCCHVGQTRPSSLGSSSTVILGSARGGARRPLTALAVR